MSSEHALNQERGLDARNPFLTIIGCGCSSLRSNIDPFALFTFSFLAIMSLLHMLRNGPTIRLVALIARPIAKASAIIFALQDC